MTDRWPAGSIFTSLAEASAFFQAGSLGYSITPVAGRFEGMELRCQGWQVEPLAMSSVRSSYFDERTLFPAGALEFDNALLMRNVPLEGHSQSDLCCRSA